MVHVSRMALLLAGTAVLLVLVGVFFGVYSNDNGGSSTTAPAATTLRPTTPGPSTASPTTPSPPSPPRTPPTASVVGCAQNSTCGDVEGEWVASAAGGWYAAFRGIPYAEPPVGSLRFKGARPPAKWEGVRAAKTEGSPCVQSGTVGSEDCLYLNVYVPLKSAAPQALPVYVFIHGGVFQYGSGSASNFGPDFLVAQDMIVVTMNFRLGVLGYLSLDTEEIPGNQGLKDAVFALQWVNKNIAAFGGDPSRVTLGGQSSGGVSASWLSILPATKGLIRAAIVQSGTAVSSWGLNLKNVEFAKLVYENIEGIDTDNLDEIARLMRFVTPKQLHDAAQAATLQLQEADQGLGTDISFFYLPTLELRADGAESKLITKDPESYIIQGDTDVPIIVGETKREWGRFLLDLDMYKNATVLDEAIKNLATLVPYSIVPGTDTQKLLGIEEEVQVLINNQEVQKYVQNITDTYFTKNTDEECNQRDICKMAKFLDQVYIMADTDHLLSLRAKYTKSLTFSYVFNLKSDYNGDYSGVPDYLQNGVFHGADLLYIWKMDGVAQEYSGNSTASRALRRQVTLLANFIKNGNPTPETSELITELWLPINNGGSVRYLEITENLTMHNDRPSGPDGAFWGDIFSYFRLRKSP